MKLFQPDMEKLRNEMDANPTRDPESVKEFQKKYKTLMKKHDVNPLKSMLTPLAQVCGTADRLSPSCQARLPNSCSFCLDVSCRMQIPVFIGFFWGLQDISKYFPEYAHEGIGWVKDLSVADPTTALPVISSALLVASVELGGDAMTGEMKDKMKFGMRCFAVLMVPLTMNFQSVCNWTCCICRDVLVSKLADLFLTGHLRILGDIKYVHADANGFIAAKLRQACVQYSGDGGATLGNIQRNDDVAL